MQDEMETRLVLALREIRTLNRDLLHAWDEIDELKIQLDAMKGDENDGKND